MKDILAVLDVEDRNISLEWELMEFYTANLLDGKDGKALKEAAMERRSKERIVTAMVPFGIRGSLYCLM